MLYTVWPPAGASVFYGIIGAASLNVRDHLLLYGKLMGFILRLICFISFFDEMRHAIANG